jgi:hypothetical protein
MKSSLFCLLVVLISVFVSAQSSVVQPFNQRTRISPSTPRWPRRIPFGQGRAIKGTKATAEPFNGAPQTFVLNFAPAVLYGSGGSGANSVAVADVNGDGKPDIVVANENVVAVLLGNGDGTFQAAVTYGSGGAGAGPAAVADVNGDGKPDIVVGNDCLDSNCYTSGVGVLLGNGDGTFQAAVTYGSGGFGPNSVAVADLNGDGKSDIVVGNDCDSNGELHCETGPVDVLLGNGDGTFQPAVPYYSYESPQSIAVADVNGDGKLDLVVGTSAFVNIQTLGEIDVFLGNGDGTFQLAVTYDSGQGAWGVAVADVNGDGKPDIVSAEVQGGIGVLLGNGDGTFQQPVIYESGYAVGTVAVADLNGDGKPDIVRAEGDGGIGVLLGNGDGTFQQLVTYGAGITTSSIAAADVNGDGKPDLVATDSTGEAQDMVGVLINTSGAPTTISLVSSLNPANPGQSVTFTATVTSQSSQDTPTGSVSFFDGTTKLGSSALDGSGRSSLTNSTLAVGIHSITAMYSGDKVFAQNTSTALIQIVQGGQPAATLTPTLVDFGSQHFGAASAPQNLTLTNTAYMPVTISSIGITGTNASDFAQSNNCGPSVPVNSNCTISVTFTPTGVGGAVASLIVADNVAGSPQSVSLTGTGVGARIDLSPSSMTFVNQYVGTSGIPQTLTVTNTGNDVLTISAVTSSVADFGTLSNCANPVDPGMNCTIGVFFDPSASGARTGILLIHDNGVGSPQNVSLSGTGQDFSLASSSSSTATIAAGQIANYTIAVNPLGGFNQTVALSCNGAPAQSSCSLSTNSVKLNGSSSTNIKVTVTTAGNSAGLANPLHVLPMSGNRLALWLPLCGVPGLALVGIWGSWRKRHGSALYGLALLCLLSLGAGLSGCGGGGTTGTPAGTYTISVIGAFSSNATSLTHTTKLTLTVQ